MIPGEKTWIGLVNGNVTGMERRKKVAAFINDLN